MGGSVLLVTKDLFFVPSIRATAEQMNARCVIESGYEGLARLVDPQQSSSETGGTIANDDSERLDVQVCLIDLTSMEQDELPAVSELVSQKLPTARLVGFGPHVHRDKMAAAESAGFDQVISRGKLNANLIQLMTTWLGSG